MPRKDKHRTGWRAWSIAATPEGPILSAPFTVEEMQRAHLYPDMRAEATCIFSIPPHESPHPNCTCGMYLMTKYENLDQWCFPCDVVTTVKAHGPILKGGNGGLMWRGERRCKAIEIVPGPARISPRMAHHAPALAERYGLEFTVDSALDQKPGLQRFEDSLEDALEVLSAMWEAYAPDVRRPF